MVAMKIAIIGAGPTGLVAAHELLKTGASVTVFEGEGAVGGLVRMIPSEGEPLEAFYHHIFTSDGARDWLHDHYDGLKMTPEA